MRFVLRFFGFLFSLGAIAFLIAAAAAAYFYWQYSQDLPDHAALANYEPPVMTRVHASDGSLLAEYAREKRLYIPIQAVPKLVTAAFLSAEDKNFYKHSGIDPEGIVRAALTNFRTGRKQGASTITQQVAKNFFLSNEQTLERKIREALTALRMEATFSKDRILELYLNQIFLGAPAPGQGAYGLAAAALQYFGKSVHELNLQEAAYLSALPKAPNNYHPFRRTKEALERRNQIIDLMVENKYVTRQEGDQAKQQPLGVNPRYVSPNTIASGFFAEEVRREIADRYGEKKLYEGGLSVRATLDPKLQAIARKALVDGLVRYDEARGWRGAQQKIELAGREWGTALAEVPALGPAGPVGGRRGLCGAARRQGPVQAAAGARRVRRLRGHGPVHRAHPRHGRRLLLRPERVQPRHAGPAPARLVVQALRLRRGPRQRLHALVDRHGRADLDRSGRRPGGVDA